MELPTPCIYTRGTFLVACSGCHFLPRLQPHATAGGGARGQNSSKAKHSRRSWAGHAPLWQQSCYACPSAPSHLAMQGHSWLPAAGAQRRALVPGGAEGVAAPQVEQRHADLRGNEQHDHVLQEVALLVLQQLQEVLEVVLDEVELQPFPHAQRRSAAASTACSNCACSTLPGKPATPFLRHRASGQYHTLTLPHMCGRELQAVLCEPRQEAWLATAGCSISAMRAGCCRVCRASRSPRLALQVLVAPVDLHVVAQVLVDAVALGVLPGRLEALGQPDLAGQDARAHDVVPRHLCTAAKLAKPANPGRCCAGHLHKQQLCGESSSNAARHAKKVYSGCRR